MSHKKHQVTQKYNNKEIKLVLDLFIKNFVTFRAFRGKKNNKVINMSHEKHKVTRKYNTKIRKLALDFIYKKFRDFSCLSWQKG